MRDDGEDDCCRGGLLTSNDARTAIISGDTFKNRTV
jgi:astacin